MRNFFNFQNSLSHWKTRLSKWTVAILLSLATAQVLYNTHISYQAQDDADRFASELVVYDVYENLKSKKEQDELLEVWKI